MAPIHCFLGKAVAQDDNCAEILKQGIYTFAHFCTLFSATCADPWSSKKPYFQSEIFGLLAQGRTAGLILFLAEQLPQ